MRYSFFAGCKIPYFLREYGHASLALLNKFNIELIDIEFNCCGYPVRDIDFQSFIFSGARNLALAEQKNTGIVTPCGCCYGSLKFVEHYLRRHPEMKRRINGMLQQEGLQWEDHISVKHLLAVLYRDIGLQALRAAVIHSLKGLRVAIHAGCHAFRPGNVAQFDNPLAPTIFNDLVAVTGAESVYWSMSMECCGNPQWGKNKKLALKQMQRKLINAKEAGADFVFTGCTYCQIQFEQKQETEFTEKKDDQRVPAILVSQLIGFSIGLSDDEIGLRDDYRQQLIQFTQF